MKIAVCSISRKRMNGCCTHAFNSRKSICCFSHYQKIPLLTQHIPLSSDQPCTSAAGPARHLPWPSCKFLTKVTAAPCGTKPILKCFLEWGPRIFRSEIRFFFLAPHAFGKAMALCRCILPVTGYLHPVCCFPATAFHAAGRFAKTINLSFPDKVKKLEAIKSSAMLFLSFTEV